jgi:hypothetical protein
MKHRLNFFKVILVCWCCSSVVEYFISMVKAPEFNTQHFKEKKRHFSSTKKHYQTSLHILIFYFRNMTQIIKINYNTFLRKPSDKGTYNIALDLSDIVKAINFLLNQWIRWIGQEVNLYFHDCLQLETKHTMRNKFLQLTLMFSTKI